MVVTWYSCYQLLISSWCYLLYGGCWSPSTCLFDMGNHHDGLYNVMWYMWLLMTSLLIAVLVSIGTHWVSIEHILEKIDKTQSTVPLTTIQYSNFWYTKWNALLTWKKIRIHEANIYIFITASTQKLITILLLFKTLKYFFMKWDWILEVIYHTPQ